MHDSISRPQVRQWCLVSNSSYSAWNNDRALPKFSLSAPPACKWLDTLSNFFRSSILEQVWFLCASGVSCFFYFFSSPSHSIFLSLLYHYILYIERKRFLAFLKQYFIIRVAMTLVLAVLPLKGDSFGKLWNCNNRCCQNSLYEFDTPHGTTEFLKHLSHIFGIVWNVLNTEPLWH